MKFKDNTMMVSRMGRKPAHSNKDSAQTSLVVQWIRICLPMQGTWVQFLVREDSTCCGATKPVCPQLLSLHAVTTEAHVSRICAL